jgi:hypothetical protein
MLLFAASAIPLALALVKSLGGHGTDMAGHCIRG